MLQHQPAEASAMHSHAVSRLLVIIYPPVLNDQQWQLVLYNSCRHAHPRANDFFTSQQQLHDVLTQLAKVGMEIDD